MRFCSYDIIAYWQWRSRDWCQTNWDHFGLIKNIGRENCRDTGAGCFTKPLIKDG